MLKVNDIKAKTFNTVKNGFDPDEVISFLGEIARDYSAALTANEDSEAKLIKLVEKINEYRADEDAIKDAMINAQKEASKTVNEAKAKATEMIETAKKEKDRIAEESAAECEQIINEHKEKCAQLIKENTEVTEKKINEMRTRFEQEKASYETLKSEVTRFKANLAELYNKQLHLIMEIPEVSAEKPAEQKAEAAVEAVVVSEEINEVSEPVSDDKDEHLEKLLNTDSFEPVIPKESFADLKFGKNN